LALGFFTQQLGDWGVDGIERALHAVIGFGSLSHRYRP
jgi:hypothetical protein